MSHLKHLYSRLISQKFLKTSYVIRSGQFIPLKDWCTTPLCTSSKEEKQRNIKIVQDAPVNATSDCIGPPDPISNIPVVQFYSPPNETVTEKEFRLERIKVLEWNHKFWSIHNEQFFKHKDEFVMQHKKLQTGGKKKSLGPEEIAVFYRHFLNENRASHLNYNKEWYKKNIMLLWPALKVVFIRLRRRLTRGKSEQLS